MPARKIIGVNRGPRPAKDEGNLDEEIAMLRDHLRQLAEKAESEEDVVKQARILAVLSQAVSHLARILKMQKDLGGGESLIAEVHRVADIVRHKMEQRSPD